MKTPFQAGGPLEPARGNPYILRKADTQTIEHLRNMDYLLLIEPRQQGKTSLIFRLMSRPELVNYAFVYIDIGSLSTRSESGWYHSLCTRITAVLKPRLNWSNPPAPPTDHSGWETYLHSVGHQAAAQDVRVVIALDEIGGASFAGSSEFFKVLHAVRTSRVPYPEFNLITFLLAGVFHPRDLIEDDRVSPFNVACRIDLEDFTPAQTLELVAQGPWLKHKTTTPAGQPKLTQKVKTLAKWIHYWTDGQPFLTQLFCQKLGDKATSQEVDDLADTFVHQDETHVLPLVQRVVADPALHRIVKGLLDGQPTEYTPSTVPDLGRLLLTGAIKINKRNMCLIRNRLYEKAFGKNPGGGPPFDQLYGTGNRWAVVVGVNEYEDQAHYGDLQVCVKDAEAIHKQLVAVGYQPDRIKILTDHTTGALPTRDNILVALSAIAEATEPEDLLVFYYSGHGDQDEKESYLVARNGKRMSLVDTAVKASRIKQIMEQAPARAKVIILDACHSGANIKGKGSHMTAAFIRRVFEQAEGLAILASCKQGQVSYEWEANERSVFTYYLLEALQGHADLDHKGFVTIQDANHHLSNSVRLWASQRNRIQTPTLQAEVAGEIILAYLPANE